jgi:DNA-binding GntR family transcriptional regulator
VAAANIGVTASLHVSPPRITTAPVSFECRTFQVIRPGPQQTIILAEVLAVHVNDALVLDADRLLLDTPRMRSSFRAVWLGAVPNSQLRRLIELHDDHVQWLRQLTLHDAKVRKKVIVGLRNILAALDEGKPTAVSGAMLAHLDAAEQALTTALEQSRRNQTAA